MEPIHFYHSGNRSRPYIQRSVRQIAAEGWQLALWYGSVDIMLAQVVIFHTGK